MSGSTSRPVALLVGCSGGIGGAIATALADAGLTVYGTSRAGTSTAGLDPSVLTPVALDVTDEASVSAAVDRVVADTGRLDVLVHNAGATLIGAIEETSPAEASRMLDVNLLGVHRVVRAALPHLREARGRVVVTGSIAGFVVKPYEAWYGVAKHGLDAYAETLRAEVGPLGVRVTLLEPGFIRTDLGEHAATTTEQLPVYDRGRRSATSGFARDLAHGAPPAAVGRAVQKVLGQDDPPLRVLVGRDAHALNVVKRLLPDRLYEAGMRVRFAPKEGR